jgi:cellulose synthase/poly-beta-1,6-N-acetylglucosamine synthase-like glycosyltransferase
MIEIGLLVIALVLVLLIFHSYVLFPFILNLLAKGKMQNDVVFEKNDPQLPTVAILLAVYNEESVIEEKIKSTFATTYPVSKIKLYIGSDASTDKTNEIIQQYAERYPIELTIFAGRTGKSSIINALSEIALGDVFVLTDANVFFHADTMYHLCKHYKNEKIAQVGGNIINSRVKVDGISVQEKSYLSRENKIKYQEGVLWGAMIGAFGGCYSIRRDFFVKVPHNFLMDDFYISMNVLEKKKWAINELDAKCEEDVSNILSEEFRRKIRISAGNFQNLNRYKGLLRNPFSGVGFSFLSHKVIRWYTPMLLLMFFILNIVLCFYENFYLYPLLIQVLLMLTPLVDKSLQAFQWNNRLIRFVTHFYLMNLALLQGYIWYKQGVKSNVWKPTQRNQ